MIVHPKEWYIQSNKNEDTQRAQVRMDNDTEFWLDDTEQNTSRLMTFRCRYSFSTSNLIYSLATVAYLDLMKVPHIISFRIYFLWGKSNGRIINHVFKKREWKHYEINSLP